MSKTVTDSLLQHAKDAAACQADVNALRCVESELAAAVERFDLTPNTERKLANMLHDIREVRRASEQGRWESLASFNRELRDGGVM